MKNEKKCIGSRPLTSFLFTVLAICTVLGNFRVITDSFREAYISLVIGEKRRAEYIEGPRALVADNLAPTDSICFISSGDVREKSAETAVIQAVNWQVMRYPNYLAVVPNENAEDIVKSGEYDAVLSPSFDSHVDTLLASSESIYEQIAERGGRTLWRRKRHKADVLCEPVGPAFHEVAGLVPIATVVVSGALAGGASGVLIASVCFSLLIMIGAVFNLPSYFLIFETLLSWAVPWFVGHTRYRGGKCIVILSVALGIFAAFAFLTLAHTFTTPYGLAITGGRARLWHELSGKAGGFLRCGFFSNPSWKILEPVYPPGCTAITLGCYQTTGMYGEWLTQLIGCSFFAVSAGFALGKCEGCAKRLWMLSLFFVPAALTVGGQFYPEPIMALCILVGWDRIRTGNADWISWALLGAAGWFKNEGLVFAIASWIAWRIAGGRTFVQIRTLAAGLLLPLIWHIGSRICGGTLNDYAPVGQFSFGRAVSAFFEIVRELFVRPWHHALAYPVAFACAVCWKWNKGQCPSGLLAALIFTGISLLTFTCIYACGTADLEWHMATSLQRLLWTPALVLAYEISGEN